MRFWGKYDQLTTYFGRFESHDEVVDLVDNDKPSTTGKTPVTGAAHRPCATGLVAILALSASTT